MTFDMKLPQAALLAALWVASLGAGAQTVRVANQGDSLSMDPHSLNSRCS
jgi:peptide/nickel transport system substrate-binding protein